MLPLTAAMLQRLGRMENLFLVVAVVASLLSRNESVAFIANYDLYIGILLMFTLLNHSRHFQV